MYALCQYHTSREKFLQLKQHSLSANQLLPPRFQYDHNYDNGTNTLPIPGSVIVGDLIMTYRSEHFLADAQATSDKKIKKGKPKSQQLA